MASFSGQFTDYDPFISPDGKRLFFCTNRSEGGTRKQDFDIWYVEKDGEGWRTPTSVGVPINTKSNEYCPSVAADGTLYFSSNWPGGKGGYDIYRARMTDGKYGEPEDLGDNVNQKGNGIDCYMSPDQTISDLRRLYNNQLI